MNLRVVCLGLGLLSIAASGDPCTGTGTGSSGGPPPDVGVNGAACESTTSAGIDGTPCCGAVNDPCQNDYECCTGSCSGNFGDGGSTCGDPANPSCLDALSSRCNTGQCQCTSDADCCIGICAPTAISGTGPSTTLRCCQPVGQPCGANSDCCDLTCDPTTFQCD
jgi:hypothetical protein